ncbi:hypothetical protein [Nonomuraea lactucae]|uniref:hypothetical protein n=1 Tax=Nonomuraea lactucae TaxID=2249762 RepID=UPI000DE1D896|nr:hypothetical protein [Nonomuraea lactucae]
MRIAISGHRDLSRETAGLVRSAIREILQPFTADLVGVSCLAPGADQIFADVVVELGGRLEVVVPARQYGRRLPAAHRSAYARRLRHAASVRSLPFELPSPRAYASANGLLLEGADLLLAVWDGRPPRGAGGTAEAVRDARARGMEVRVIWPEGALRVP